MALLFNAFECLQYPCSAQRLAGLSFVFRRQRFQSELRQFSISGSQLRIFTKNIKVPGDCCRVASSHRAAEAFLWTIVKEVLYRALHNWPHPLSRLRWTQSRCDAGISGRCQQRDQ